MSKVPLLALRHTKATLSFIYTFSIALLDLRYHTPLSSEQEQTNSQRAAMLVLPAILLVRRRELVHRRRGVHGGVAVVVGLFSDGCVCRGVAHHWGEIPRWFHWSVRR